MANTQVTGDLIANGAITAAKLSNVTTDTISEGTALYYTDARVASYLSANSYATEGYVTTAVNNLIDAAPASLDTLNELAAALNDDANFATTVTNALATKLNLSGGTISGNLTVTGSIAGTLSTAAQTSITSVGSLSSLAVNGDVSIADKIVHTGDTDTSIRFLANNNVTIETAGVERVRVDPGGNFGVGTNNAKAVTGTFYPASGWQAQQFAGETNAALIVNGLNGVARIHLVANTSSANQKSYIIQSDSGNLAFASLNDSLSGSEKLRILAGGGITFNGDTAAANALDDYEEGAWPVQFAGVTATYDANGTYGWYTKIGNTVHFVAVVTTTSINQTSVLSGITLPFTATSSSQYFPPISLFIEKGFNPSGDAGNIQGIVQVGQSRTAMYVISNSTTNNYLGLNYTSISDSSRIRVQGSYQI